MTGFEGPWAPLAPRPPRWRWPMLHPLHWGARFRCYRCRWALDIGELPEFRDGRRESRRVEFTDLPGMEPLSLFNLAALCTDCWQLCTVDERVEAHLWLWRHVEPAMETYDAVRASVCKASEERRRRLLTGPDELDVVVDELAERLREWVLLPQDEDLRRGRYHSMHSRSLRAADFVTLLGVVAFTAPAEGRPSLDLDYLRDVLDDFTFGPMDGVFLRAKITSKAAEKIGSQGWGRGSGVVQDLR